MQTLTDPQLLSLFRRGQEPAFEELEAIPASGAPFEEQLRTLVATVHARRVEDFPLIQAMLWLPGTFPALDGETGSRMRSCVLRFGAGVDAVLAVGQEQGRVVPGARAPMVLALAGMMDSFAKAEIFGLAGSMPEVPESVCRAFLRGFGQGVR